IDAAEDDCYQQGENQREFGSSASPPGARAAWASSSDRAHDRVLVDNPRYLDRRTLRVTTQIAIRAAAIPAATHRSPGPERVTASQTARHQSCNHVSRKTID